MIERAKTIAIGLTEELRRPTPETMHRLYAFGAALGMNAVENAGSDLEAELRAVSEALNDEVKEHMQIVVAASVDPDAEFVAKLVLEFDAKLKGADDVNGAE